MPTVIDVNVLVALFSKHHHDLRDVRVQGLLRDTTSARGRLIIPATDFKNMHLAEDRGRFSDLLKELDIPYPQYGVAHDVDQAIEVAKRVSYPVLVRPSYVLGGQRMRIVINDQELETHVLSIFKHMPDNKVLIDQFLERAKEAEIDAICDGQDVHIMGIMEHIEPAGIHYFRRQLCCIADIFS